MIRVGCLEIYFTFRAEVKDWNNKTFAVLLFKECIFLSGQRYSSYEVCILHNFKENLHHSHVHIVHSLIHEPGYS